MPQLRNLKAPRPLVSMAAIALIIAGLTAAGAATGLIPSAFSGRADPLTPPDALPAVPVAPSVVPLPAANEPVLLRSEGRLAIAPATPAPAPVAGTQQCRQCGVIEAVRQVKVNAQRAGVLASGANGPIVSSSFGRGDGRSATVPFDLPWGGYASQQAEKHVGVSTSYRVVVRMEDGSTRTVYQSSAPAFAVGEKVRVVKGVLAARG